MTDVPLDEVPDRHALALEYQDRKAGYEKALSELLSRVGKTLRKAGLRLTLKGRVKDFDSLYEKKLRLLRKAHHEGGPPLPVNDVIALRAVCPFLGDLQIAERALCESFEVVEIERKGAERSFREFGYESIHVLAAIPEALMPLCEGLERPIFEIQLRTILQEAWAEVEHELVYKAEFTPFDEPMKRKLAALNANLTLSDIIFQEILEYQKKLNGQLSRRRSAFHEKIEDVADAPGISPEITLADGAPDASPQSSGPAAACVTDDDGDMDRLLLQALEAHNAGDFCRAVALYTRIIAKRPGKEAAAVLYKHRGMAHFAQSRYREALEDFSSCLELDPECYKAAYYRGVVKAVLQDHQGAVQDYGAALRIHPYHFFSRYRRAVAWWRLGDAAQALSDCESALHLQPENATVRALRDRIRATMSAEEP